MNVFVLSTGRCGSTTFAYACAHITNFTAGHETRAGLPGAARLEYPREHIESDNRLSWFLGRLDRCYGREAFYLHLTRERQAVAESYARRLRPGMIMPAYARGIYLGMDDESASDPLALALDYVDTVTANIELFLADKPNRMAFRLENAREDFRRFWNWIGAEGDLEAALAEFDVTHNAGEP